MPGAYVLTNAGMTAAVVAPESAQSSILDAVSFNPATQAIYTPSTTLGDVDATNAAVTFTAPASGVVYLKFECTVTVGAATTGLFLCLREGASTIAGTKVRRHYIPNNANHAGRQDGMTASWVVSGLTPGSEHTFKVAWQRHGVGTGTPTEIATGDPTGASWGPMVTVVSSAPL